MVFIPFYLFLLFSEKTKPQRNQEQIQSPKPSMDDEVRITAPLLSTFCHSTRALLKLDHSLNTLNTRGFVMAHQRRTRSLGNSGRGYRTPQREKTKARATGQKRRSSGSYVLEENNAPNLEEVADRTLNRLRSLGNQRFALSPFNEHFSRWLRNLRDVLSEFESSPAINVDDPFVKERSQILSNVEFELEERRREEVSREETVKRLSNSARANRILLERIDKEYTTRMNEIEGRKNREIKRLSANADGLKEELDQIARMKTGIFRAISKKARAQKEAEITQRLNLAQRKLALTLQQFTTEQEGLRDKYDREKQPIIEQIRDQQKEIENQEIDGSVEARRAACAALLNAVNALLQRKRS